MKMKSVLFLNRVYPPDHGATGQLLAELAEALTQAGWQVSIVTAGTPPRESRNSKLEIHRVRGLPFTRAALWKRALAYASLYPALLGRALRLPRHEVIVTLTDPPLLLLLGPLLKFWKRSRLVHWAQDIYPEVAEELGVVRKKGFAAGLLRWLSSWALRRHDAILVVGRCMKERLMARGLAPEKITVLPNWPVGKSGSRGAEGRSGKSEVSGAAGHPPQSSISPPPFTVMYSGNFGLAHPFEAIIEAVKILDHEAAPVRFILAGSGPKLESLRTALAGCPNVEFRGPAPLDQLHASLSAADAHLASMHEELCGLVVPSKVYGVLAAGRPCVFLGPPTSEVARLILESGTGAALSVDDGRALAGLLRGWAARGVEYQRVRAASERWAAAQPGVPLEQFCHALAGGNAW